MYVNIFFVILYLDKVFLKSTEGHTVLHEGVIKLIPLMYMFKIAEDSFNNRIHITGNHMDKYHS